MRKFVAIFFLLFVMLSANSASAYTVSAPTQTFAVPTMTTKQVDITVTGNEAETLTVNLVESKPWVTLAASQTTLRPGVPETVSIFVSPFIDTNVGLYKISVLFESLLTKDLKKADIFVSIQKVNIVNLEKIVVAGDIEPLGSAKVAIHVKNFKTITVNGVEVSANISSPSKNLAVINRIIPKLDPDEESTVDTTIFFDKLALPELYVVDARVKYQDEIIASKQTFRVATKPVLQVQKDAIPLVFGSRTKITITNFGNAVGDQTITESLSGFERAFFYGDEPAAKFGDTYSWVVSNILPGETRVVQYSVDYTGIFLIIFALVIATWVYFKKMRTLRIRKYIVQKKKIEEGEEFTVAVEIKNATGKETNADIYDFVPSVFTVKDSSGPKPAKKKSGVGTELKWGVKNLKNKEERVFSYKIAPIFGIHGTIKLPRASVIFELNGKTFENRSFSHSIGLIEKEEPWGVFRKK